MNYRADEALVLAGLAKDENLARALIMEGRALYGCEKLMKPSDKVKNPELLRIKGELESYVSRGAHKLKKAFEVFDISAQGKVCMDVGASTGGFTDIILRNGARKVYSIDVGYNLLDYKLRSDDRVVCMEKTNARLMTKDMFDEVPEFGATDVSFISLKAILPAVFAVLKEGADFIALIKPQFEADRSEVGEKGVVRDVAVHKKVIASIIDYAEAMGITVKNLDYSPIRGPEGNIEFLLHLVNNKTGVRFNRQIIDEIAEKANVNFS